MRKLGNLMLKRVFISITEFGGDVQKSKDIFEYEFNRAKKLSDFVGMLTRLSFCVAIPAFLIVTEVSFPRFIINIAICTFSILALAMYNRILQVLSAYFFVDIAETSFGKSRSLAVAAGFLLSTIWVTSIVCAIIAVSIKLPV
jgi:hypothetical protein